jgi:hypothetical protein
VINFKTYINRGCVLEEFLSGIQEILLIILLILALVILPRIFSSSRTPVRARPVRADRIVFSGKFRLAILISVLWLFGLSAVYAPWRGQWLAFLYAGGGPLIAAWGLYWVVIGFRNRRRH